MKRNPNILFLTISFVFFACISNAQIPERPSPPRLVNDFANVLKNNERDALEKKLVAYYDSTSTQIAIVIMPDLGGYDAAGFSFELAEKWGIGKKSKNNGILILMSVQERDVFIAPGYGVEEFIPDAISKRIVNNYLIPNFKQGNFYKGFDEATDVMIGLLTGKFTADDIDDGKIPLWLIILVIVIVIIIITLGNKGGGGGGHTYTGKGHRPYSGGGPIIWGGGGSRGGSSWGGGGRSGGFGGFGGGSFGGAGAGGKW
jgi:uncharacterized protein